MKWFTRLFRKSALPQDDVPASERLASSESYGQFAKKTRGGHLPFESLLPYFVVASSALMTADLVSTYSRSYMIPSASPVGAPAPSEPAPFRARSEYDDVLTRNIFNSDGLIPGVDGESGTALANDEGTARESQLPLTLLGTIVHVDPGRSLATIESKSGGTGGEGALPYKPNEDVLGVATLIKVERKKAFIRNNSSRALEYITIKDDPAIEFNKKASGLGRDGIVTRESDDTFALNRTDLNAQIDNIQELLTQALALPNEVPGVGTDGFRIVNIQPDSLFSKLGIKDNDVIKFVDGQKIDSVSKAMELYNALRSRNQIRLQVERGGRLVTQTYNIR